ncbi:MAG: MarR family transcriptional regulator [Desulfobacterota bacterium]|nr:MarR family transcriptional regulator [Thermodesulfobacteriota bacterium]
MEHRTGMEMIQEIEEHMTEIRNIFVRIFNRMVRSNKKFSDIPFSLSQMKALSAFHEDRQYTMSELSKNALVKMPSMTEMVDRLEAEGILKRIRDTKDRRVVKVSLTERGKKIHAKMIGRRREEMSKLFGQLSSSDLNQLVAALREVSSILRKITNDEEKKRPGKRRAPASDEKQ